jgi:site-specific DNA-methyltransferase (cytosine-N4-specific)
LIDQLEVAMEPYYADDQLTLWHGDALATLRGLPDGSVNCCVTSPPYYGLRDYGEPGQYGLESTPAEYVETMRAVFGEVRRVLADDGTCWINVGDSYVGSAKPGAVSATLVGTSQRVSSAGTILTKPGVPKNLLGMPWRVAFALQDNGWILRNAIAWDKPNAMPESVTDRLSTTYEMVFMFARSQRYWFDLDAVREPCSDNKPWGAAQRGPGKAAVATAALRGTRPEQQQSGLGRNLERVEHPLGRNPGDVWQINTAPFPAAHFAVMAPELARRCILAGCKPGGVVLDPFTGSGTTGMVALKHGRRFVGIDLSATYLDLALRTRLAQTALVDGMDGAA